jgi:hypothetical protein
MPRDEDARASGAYLLAALVLVAFPACAPEAASSDAAVGDGEAASPDDASPPDGAMDAALSMDAAGGNPALDEGVDGAPDGLVPPSDGGEDAVADATVDADAPCTDGSECDCQTGVCAPPRVFRMTELVLVDPHTVWDEQVFVPSILAGMRACRDITHAPISVSIWIGIYSETFTLPGLNPELNDRIAQDGYDDGYLDLSVMVVSGPHVQEHDGRGVVTTTHGLCDAADPTTCVPDPDAPNAVPAHYTSLTSGTCLAPIAGTTGPVLEAIAPNTVTAPCFVSDPAPLTLRLDFGAGPVLIPLTEARLAGSFTADPATGISHGLLRGFLPMDVADATSIMVHVEDLGDFSVNLGKHLLPDDTDGGGGAHGCGTVLRVDPDQAGTNDHLFDTRELPRASPSCVTSAGDARDLLNPEEEASYSNCGWHLYFNWTGIWAENASGF